MTHGKSEITRVARSKDDARNTYDRLSKWYDLLAGGSERKFTEVGLRKLDVKEGEKVLEIGFGTGHSLLALARRVGMTGKVYGVDLSEGMLQVASNRLSTNGMSNRVELHCGDATRLPFPDQFFDAVFMSFVLELFDTPELPLVMRECQRVLNRTGRIGIVALSKKECDRGAALRVVPHAIPFVRGLPSHLRASIRGSGGVSSGGRDGDADVGPACGYYHREQ